MSAECLALVRERIRATGPLTFAEFMELALYAPEVGYYTRAAQVTGRTGDFFTSVDVGHLFGELLAVEFAEMAALLAGDPALPRSSDPLPLDLIEAAAGNGRLARDVLDGLAERAPDLYAGIRLHLVEPSARARAAQPSVLGPHAARLASAGEGLPATFRGILYANELLDALPTHVVMTSSGGLSEVFVDLEGDQLVERLGEPSTGELEAYLSRVGATLEPGARAEISLDAVDWLRRALESLDTGFLTLVDYGHDAATLYGASHAGGTLTTFRAHTTGTEDGPSPPWLRDPGSCDITAHVDLTSIRLAAEAAGAETLCVTDQTYALTALASRLGLFDAGRTDAATAKRRLALKTLVLPGGLGSTHKMLIFGKNVGRPALLACSFGKRVT